MGKGAPKPPDPWETAGAQSAANQFAAQQNFGLQNVNEFTPYGSKTYAQSGSNKIYDPFTKQYIDSPTYSSTVNLSPGEQAILNSNTAMRQNLGNLGVSQSARLQSLLGKNVTTKGLQGWNAGPGVQTLRQDQAPTDRKAIEDAMMARYSRYANPRNEAQEAEMAARGMSPGGQGYGAMQQARGDEFGEATRAAYLGSGQESRAAQDAFNKVAQQRFEQGGSAADRQNALRQAQWTERLSERNQPINEIMALLGGAGVNTPQFQPYQGSQVQAPNIGQMIYDQFNAQSQQSANNMSGMFGIGSAVAGALPWASWLSDRRAKQDIKPFGGSFAGVPLYWFRYKSDPTILQVGVMADEVKKIHPDAVHVVDGYEHVDYELLRRRHQD